MATLFLSDLHLSATRPEKLELFYRLLVGPAAHSEGVYILGDLFDLWIGDDDHTEPNRTILQAMMELSMTGVPVYVMHGNRDFLMGKRFLARTNCRLLPDVHIIDLYGRKTLLLHGDILCTKDADYQQFRRKVRDPKWQRLALAIPLFLRKSIAKKMRADALAHSNKKPAAIMDVTQETVESLLTQHRAWQMIHGHTHRPAIHDFWLAGQPARRIVLGDWYQGDSVLVCDSVRQRLLRVEELLADPTT